ncbi:hypothetical protein X777_15044 [Ooceraea biroi]|uniref:Odorant receptor n=1 Tax=Ooceraea biroi TaxID=2015173 RepID=A0A026VVX4_OOCBI|nr:hypothetical protein X777_15044 [Ooceraea biroi]
MVCIKKRYFNWNRLFLLPLGLWPDKETKFTRFQAKLLFSLLMSSAAFQLSRLFSVECHFDSAVTILSSSSFYIALTIIFMCFWINMKTMRYLFEQLQHIYDGLKDKAEIAIYDKYGYIGKCLTIRLMIPMVCGMFSNFIIVYSPYILDVVMPKNESYAIHVMEMVTKYFIVSEKYYFLVLVHLNVACTAGLIVTVGTGTMMLSYFKHACGMFEIASYRIEQAMAIELLHDLNTKNEIVIYKKIICAVDIHRKAMEFAKCFITNTEGTLFFLILTGVLCLSFNLFRIFQIKSLVDEVEEVLLHFFVVILVLVGSFLANYVGQEMMDYTNHVYETTYNVSWYLAPLDIQKMILFLLQRGSRTFTLNVGGLFTASFECFATLVSASVSYFTFMYSMQQ